jgi:tripartite-type tricarboxylate transporter receptor subunit TctC
MKLTRRNFLHLAAGAAALPIISRNARAQAYPSRPVRIIIGFPAGGGQDIFCRLIGQWLASQFGQPFIIENRPGAGGNIAAESVARAPADGYTLLSLAVSNAISVTLYENLRFDFIRDIVPVASFARAPQVMEVTPSFPAKTVPEFIAYAKANSAGLNMASPGTGSSVHLCGELFKMMTGVNLIHVPYRGAPAAAADLMSGRVQVMFDNLPNSIEYIRSGRVRGLAVTTAMRSEALPGVPTVGDFVPGYEAISWWGIGAPKNTPVQVVETLNGQINAGLANPLIAKQFANLAATVSPSSSAEFRSFIANETAKWAKVIKFAGVKVE